MNAAKRTFGVHPKCAQIHAEVHLRTFKTFSKTVTGNASIWRRGHGGPVMKHGAGTIGVWAQCIARSRRAYTIWRVSAGWLFLRNSWLRCTVLGHDAIGNDCGRADDWACEILFRVIRGSLEIIKVLAGVRSLVLAALDEPEKSGCKDGP